MSYLDQLSVKFGKAVSFFRNTQLDTHGDIAQNVRGGGSSSNSDGSIWTRDDAPEDKFPMHPLRIENGTKSPDKIRNLVFQGLVVSFVFFLTACKNEHAAFEGTWSSQSSNFSATTEIEFVERGDVLHASITQIMDGQRQTNEFPVIIEGDTVYTRTRGASDVPLLELKDGALYLGATKWVK